MSLRRLLTLPYAALIIGVSLLIGALSYRAGSQAVDTMSDQLLLETVARIGQAVDRHIVGSSAVLEAAFPNGMPAPAAIDNSLEELRTRFWIASSLHLDPNNYVYYGSRSGQFIGLWRFSQQDAELRLKLHAGEPRTLYRFSGIGGALGGMTHEPSVFEPRERPWFKAGANSPSHTWTSIYIDFKTAELVATRARRVLAASGELQGVVATDVSLRALNDFVRRLQVSEHALAFIIEPDGQLIASSRSANVQLGADGRNQRLNAAASGDALQVAAYAEVQRVLAAQEAASGANGPAQTLRFAGPDGASIQLAFDRLRDAAGLDWITVVAVPRSDFMHGITGNVMRTGVIAAAAALVAALLGLWILGGVAADLHRIADGARAVGAGRLDATLEVRRPDEIGDLADSFRAMQQRLRLDVLTGLVNREVIVRHIADRIGQQRRIGDERVFAVMFLDLNNFKGFNDSLGHEAGDKVLVEIGSRLRTMVRAGDLVARYAGDEFMILVNDVRDATAADQVRGHVEELLREPLTSVHADGGEAIAVGGAVGLALFPVDGETVDSLLAHADADMYARKASMKQARGR
ncbi:MAG TPA: diguanylate cyclase [Burkholderiaceae bacterium]